MGRVKELLFDQLEQIEQIPFDSLEHSLGHPLGSTLVVIQGGVNTGHYRKSHPEKRSDVIEQFLGKLKIS